MGMVEITLIVIAILLIGLAFKAKDVSPQPARKEYKFILIGAYFFLILALLAHMVKS